MRARLCEPCVVFLLVRDKTRDSATSGVLQEEQPPSAQCADVASVAAKECPAPTAAGQPVRGITAAASRRLRKRLPDIDYEAVLSDRRETRRRQAREPGFLFPGGSRIQRWRCGWLVLHWARGLRGGGLHGRRRKRALRRNVGGANSGFVRMSVASHRLIAAQPDVEAEVRVPGGKYTTPRA
ncbi:hypothetical protein MRX96_021413 [Rhipicephalus microplus]